MNRIGCDFPLEAQVLVGVVQPPKSDQALSTAIWPRVSPRGASANGNCFTDLIEVRGRRIETRALHEGLPLQGLLPVGIELRCESQRSPGRQRTAPAFKKRVVRMATASPNKEIALYGAAGAGVLSERRVAGLDEREFAASAKTRSDLAVLRNVCSNTHMYTLHN